MALVDAIDHLPGIAATRVVTDRGTFHVLVSGPEDGEAVLFVHGNVSSSTFWEDTMAALPAKYRAIAPDLRGYGSSDRLPVDATRGLRDFSDDVHAVVRLRPAAALACVHVTPS